MSGTSTNTPTTSSTGRRGSTIIPSSSSNPPANNFHFTNRARRRRAFDLRAGPVRPDCFTPSPTDMKSSKQVLTLITGGLMALNAFAAETPDRPLHVLYLGQVNVGGAG